MNNEIRNIYSDTPSFSVTHYQSDSLQGMSIFPQEISIVLCTKGRSTIMLNNSRHTLRSGINIVIRRSHHLYFEQFSDDVQLTVVSYTFEFFSLIHHILEKSVLETLYRHNAPELCKASTLKASNITLHKIISLCKNPNHTNRNRYLVSLTVGFLLERYEAIANSSPAVVTGRDNDVSHYVNRFRDLCDRLHTKERNIKVYAAELGISSRHLFEVVKKGTGLSPKQILINYLVATAKRLLLTTTLSAQQIAFMLNFGDQSNFTQFFKQNVGENPSEFRKIYFKINSPN